MCILVFFVVYCTTLKTEAERFAEMLVFIPVYQCTVWAGSSVGIATDYGLDGPGSNPGGDQIFRPSRSALGPTQAPVQWVPGLSWE